MPDNWVDRVMKKLFGDDYMDSIQITGPRTGAGIPVYPSNPAVGWEIQPGSPVGAGSRGMYWPGRQGQSWLPATAAQYQGQWNQIPPPYNAGTPTQTEPYTPTAPPSTGWMIDELRGPFGNRNWDPNYNPNLGVYQNPINRNEFGGWRYDADTGGYKFSTTGTERNVAGQPAGNYLYNWGVPGSYGWHPGYISGVGEMVNGKFVETGLAPGQTQRSATRGMINTMRAQSRRKAKERQSAFEEEKGMGTEGAAASTLTGWRM